MSSSNWHSSVLGADIICDEKMVNKERAERSERAVWTRNGHRTVTATVSPCNNWSIVVVYDMFQANSQVGETHDLALH